MKLETLGSCVCSCTLPLSTPLRQHGEHLRDLLGRQQGLRVGDAVQTLGCAKRRHQGLRMDLPGVHHPLLQLRCGVARADALQGGAKAAEHACLTRQGMAGDAIAQAALGHDAPAFLGRSLRSCRAQAAEQGGGQREACACVCARAGTLSP